jgi:hypothetical protein
MIARKQWTAKQAWAAHERFLGRGGSPSDPSAPYSQWAALHTLDDLERRFSAGEKYALLQAVRKCANHDLPMPEWLSAAFIKAFDQVHTYRAKSWDEVFGTPIPKGVQMAALKKRREKSAHVWNAVQGARSQGIPVDDELFAGVGKKLGLGVTLTKEYYAHARGQRPAVRKTTRRK